MAKAAAPPAPPQPRADDDLPPVVVAEDAPLPPPGAVGNDAGQWSAVDQAAVPSAPPTQPTEPAPKPAGPARGPDGKFVKRTPEQQTDAAAQRAQARADEDRVDGINYVASVLAARGPEAAEASRRSLIERGILPDDTPTVEAMLQGTEDATPGSAGSDPPAPRGTEATDPGVALDEETRTAVAQARQVLRRDGFTDDVLEGLPHDQVIAIAERRRTGQAEHDVARRMIGDLRKQMAELDPDFDASKYQLNGTTPTTPNGVADDSPLHGAAPEDRVSEDRLEALLADVDPETADAIRGEVGRDARPETNGTITEDRRQLQIAHTTTAVNELADEFPALKTQEGFQQFATKMKAIDPGGTRFQADPSTIKSLARDACWAAFGSQIREQAHHATVQRNRDQLNGQPVHDTINAVPTRQLSQEEIEQINYQAARQAGVGAPLWRAKQIADALMADVRNGKRLRR